MKPRYSNFILGIFLLAVTSHQKSFVDTAPTSPEVEEDDAITRNLERITEPQDTNVRDLENLKHSIGKTFEFMKTQSAIYQNMNGDKSLSSNSKTQVDSDGRLVASITKNLDQTQQQTGPTRGKLTSTVDVPVAGIHSTVTQDLPGSVNIPAVPQLKRMSALTAGNGLFNPTTLEGKVMGNSLSGGGESLAGGGNIAAPSNNGATQYSPLDMAEYVFWTGDEKGVTLAIEEFLQEGLMSREEAISFLQEIKYNLDYLQSHYTQMGLNAARERSKDPESNITPQKLSPITAMNSFPSSTVDGKPKLNNKFDLTQLRQQATASMSKKSNGNSGHSVVESDYENSKPDLYFKQSPSAVTKLQDQQMQQHQQQQQSGQEDEYEELLEKLHTADFLYTEYSLEEVIYQLAKVMFTQSLMRGSEEAQQALQKFTNFLELEAEQGRISRLLEKRVLDVLIASLTDTLAEHPELNSNPDVTSNSMQSQPSGGGQHHHNSGGSDLSQNAFLRQILQLNSAESTRNQPNQPMLINSALYKNLEEGKMQMLNRQRQLQLANARMALANAKYKST